MERTRTKVNGTQPNNDQRRRTRPRRNSKRKSLLHIERFYEPDPIAQLSGLILLLRSSGARGSSEFPVVPDATSIGGE